MMDVNQSRSHRRSHAALLQIALCEGAGVLIKPRPIGGDTRAHAVEQPIAPHDVILARTQCQTPDRRFCP
ncbi:hypothetical protein DPMN_061147 [Dreissena polymorpha]|uniref:Uncharacterized protein n=1 Tax=Dreissena polymorpha TaxID=45954 RepID=A0A9D4C757_DREPO|nr:hypothetical protein DPMN_061147 [Dreissena polymorpha]